MITAVTVPYKQKNQPELFMTHGEKPSMPSEPSGSGQVPGWEPVPKNLLPSRGARYATEPTSQRANEPTNALNPSLSDRQGGEGQQAHQHGFAPMRQGAAKEQSSPRVKVKPSGVSLSQSPRLPARELEFKSRQPTSPRMVLCKTLVVSLMCGCII
jgi:hypothetical protein